MRALPAFLLLLAGCGSEPKAAQPVEPAKAKEQFARYYCGEAFALGLRDGETVTAEAPTENSVFHLFESPKGSLVIYVGNTPMMSGTVHHSGLTSPMFVVVHEARGRPELAPDVSARVFVKKEREAHCPAKRPDAPEKDGATPAGYDP